MLLPATNDSCILGEPTIEEYYEDALKAEELGAEIHHTVMQSKAAQQLLTPGRVVVVNSPLV
jgi:antiviral helicase SKI2